MAGGSHSHRGLQMNCGYCATSYWVSVLMWLFAALHWVAFAVWLLRTIILGCICGLASAHVMNGLQGISGCIATVFWSASTFWLPDAHVFRGLQETHGCSHGFGGLQMNCGYCATSYWVSVVVRLFTHLHIVLQICTGCQSPLARHALMPSAADRKAHGPPPAEPQPLIGCVLIPIYGYDQTHNIEVQAVRAHMDSKTAETPEDMPKMP